MTGEWPEHHYDAADMSTRMHLRYRARYYDPQIGRFIREDPLGFGGNGTNFYAYAGNDPIDNVDPSGCGYIVASPCEATFLTCHPRAQRGTCAETAVPPKHAHCQAAYGLHLVKNFIFPRPQLPVSTPLPDRPIP